MTAGFVSDSPGLGDDGTVGDDGTGTSTGVFLQASLLAMGLDDYWKSLYFGLEISFDLEV